jgi:hypothetical protein
MSPVKGISSVPALSRVPWIKGFASYARWNDYTRARDDMFSATDTAWAPWFVAHSDDKRSARLNVISHLLSQVPYEAPHRKKVKLPDRKVHDASRLDEAHLRFIPTPFTASDVSAS